MIASSLPAKTLDTDIVCVLATRSSVYHSVSKLIVGRVPCHSAEQLAPVLHQNSTILRDPAHIGKQTVDVKMLPVKVSTLFISEVSLLLETWLRVAGLKFHSTSYTVFSTIFWLWSVALSNGCFDAPSTCSGAGSKGTPTSPGSICHRDIHFFGNTKSILAVLSRLALRPIGPGCVLSPAAFVYSIDIIAPEPSTLHHIRAHLRAWSKNQFTLFIHVVKDAWQLDRQRVGSGFRFIKQTLAITSV